MATRVTVADGAPLINEAEELLARYPRLDERELDRLVEIYSRLPIVDIALMISDDELGPRHEHFTRAERHRLRTPWRDILALMSPIFLFLLVIVWLVLK